MMSRLGLFFVPSFVILSKSNTSACFIFVLEFNFLAFSVAVAMAFSEMSIPVTVDCGMSRLSVMAMQPEPVQMSKMLG